MPGIVDEMRVTADRVDLHTQRLEFGIHVLQVGELGRAHEGEVARVEEDDVPLAPEVIAGDVHESAGAIAGRGEGLDRGVDQGHEDHLSSFDQDDSKCISKQTYLHGFVYGCCGLATG